MSQKINNKNRDISIKSKVSNIYHKHQAKIIMFPLFLIFILMFVYSIFTLTVKEDVKVTNKFNTELPNTINDKMIGDKRSAYENQNLENKKKENNKSLQNLSIFFDKNTEKKNTSKSDNNLKSTRNIESSARAYHKINSSVNSFYKHPRIDKEKEEMKKELEELHKKLQEIVDNNIKEENLEFLEKSYKMAAKYTPLKNNENSGNGNYDRSGKAIIQSINQVSDNVVSTLFSSTKKSLSNDKEISNSFNTVFTDLAFHKRNTIRACIYENKTITSGQSIKLRVLEQMQVGNIIVKKNTLITAIAKMQGERLLLTIPSVENKGRIIPVNISVYDYGDKIEGICVPNSMEVSALKSVLADMGGSIGSSVNISTNVQAQIASDLGKGIIQGVSKYLSKKIQVIKVHLKAGYKVMLLQKTKY